jgi:hypothetical protein
VELRDRFYSGGPVQAVVALELLYLIRDCTNWETTFQFIDSLPVDLQQQPLIKEQRALAQSKAGDHHAAIGALRALINLAGDSSERRGLLGGRYKKLYGAETNTVQKAAYLDQAIAEYEAGMQLDLNDYYPSSNLARLYRARNGEDDEQNARVSAAVTMVACERARAKAGKDPWLKPTLLGAAFDASDVARAKQLAKEVRLEGPAAWQLETTLTDLRLAVNLHSGDTSTALAKILTDLQALIAR